jgi:signal recognition particle subunit SRP54
VNVKLVASLRQKVKAKVKTVLESSGDKSKEMNRKNVIQKVSISVVEMFLLITLHDHAQAVFDELVSLVDPGVEPYKPKKGQSNVIMAVGLQVRPYALYVLPTLTFIPPCYSTGKRKDNNMY